MALRLTLTVAATALLLASACSSNSGDGDEQDAKTSQDQQADRESPGDNRLPDAPPDLQPDAAPDVVEVPPDVPDVFTSDVSAKGYGEFCLADDDCTQYGLKCFRYGPEDAHPYCSKECATNADCSLYHVCDYKLGFQSPVKICMEAKYCSQCQLDSQCQLSSMKCIPDDLGGHYCSLPCEPGKLGCAAGSHCALNPALNTWFCKPFFGACLGNGGQCSPCRFDADCKTGQYVCVSHYYTKEKFCSLTCTSSLECGDGYECVKLGETLYGCLLAWKGEIIGTCHKETQAFCGECNGEYDCKPGLTCYVGPQSSAHYCTKPCDKDEDCVEGTRCTAIWDESTGGIIGFACALEEGVACLDLLK